MEETPIISADLLRLLLCPRTGGELRMVDDKLVCDKFSTEYNIIDGIPAMLVDA